MLTRGQVAKILGRSLTTVRRMEGETLFPIVDEDGVHWFEEDDIQQAKAQLEKAGRALPRGRAAEAIWDSKQSRQDLIADLEEADRTVARLRSQLIQMQHKALSDRNLPSANFAMIRALQDDVDYLIRQLGRPNYRTELVIVRVQTALLAI